VGDGHVRPRKRDRRNVIDSDMRVLSWSVAARLGLHIAGERGMGVGRWWRQTGVRERERKSSCEYVE
jgi:hypothetical protein